MQRKSTGLSCARIGLTTVLTVRHHGAIGAVEEKLYATATSYETHKVRFYARDRHYLDLTPLCFWCRSLFRRLGQIQGFYDSAAAFHFTPFSTAVDSTASAVDFWVGVESSTNQSSLFSSFNLQQQPNLVNLSKTEFTFSHVGWTAGMECRSYSQGTGPSRSKRQSVDR